MCGIVGILLASHAARAARLDAIGAMARTLEHRGPDADGVFMDREAGIAFGHRRLAIVDLSEAGRQPMMSASERLVMTFNGEIYNYGEMRRDLEALGHRFRGHSDTEVMLEAFEMFGIEAALPRFAGMFALGLWDREQQVLHLLRDRVGKKPLYVAVTGGALVFASELKAIRAFPGFEPKVNLKAVAMALRHGYVPDQHCILEGVFKLPPGSMLSVRADELGTASAEDLMGRARTYWSMSAVAEAGQRHLLDPRDCDLESDLDRLLRKVVRQRMVADVPLGAFLSGGIDSSAVVALMQVQSSRPVRSFSIGFAEPRYDEAPHASRVARHLGTDHTEFRLTPDKALAVIPELPQIWDEPFADESQIPTLLLSRLARQHVTVALTGDGGDECFGGYARHFMAERLRPMFRLPSKLRQMAASALTLLSPGALEGILGALPFSSSTRPMLRGGNLHRLAHVLDVADERELYDRLTRLGTAPLTYDPGIAELPEEPPLPDAVARLIYRDMVGYLPGDILVKLDRASMAASLEGRCPFLDHRVIEFAWRLPSDVKVRAGQGKWLLRKVLRRYLPEELFERPKQGFDVPVGAWLRGPLRDWAQDLLDAQEIKGSGVFEPGLVEACWQQHLSGRRDRSRELWAVLMVQAWLANLAGSTPTRPLLDEAGARQMRDATRVGHGAILAGSVS